MIFHFVLFHHEYLVVTKFLSNANISFPIVPIMLDETLEYLEGRQVYMVSVLINRAETAHACAKTCNFEYSWLPATDPKIQQHLIFCSLGLKLLIYHFKMLMYPNTSISQMT